MSFAGFTWRIIRINGDGTIRLMNEDSSITSMFNPLTIGYSSAGYTYNNTHVCTIENPCISSSGTDSKIKIALESWYETNLKGYDNYIALGIYCNDTTYTEISNGRVYSGSKRIAWDSDRNPSLKCPNPASTTDYGGVYKLKIGIISADEANIGGIGTYSYPASNNNYLVRDESYFTMTPNISTNYSDYFLGVYGGDGTIDDEYTTNYTGYHVVPVINLNKDSLVSSGDGTLNNPYVIE